MLSELESKLCIVYACYVSMPHPCIDRALSVRLVAADDRFVCSIICHRFSWNYA